MYGTKQKDQALIGFVERVYSYLKKEGFQHEKERESIITLVETWNALSPDGIWDKHVQNQLEKRGLLVNKPAVVEKPQKIIQADQNPEFTNVSQPDYQTCQSAMVASALGYKSNRVPEIRKALVSLGTAGDPHVMSRYLRPKLGDRYELHLKACMADIENWLNAGYFLIVHGFPTEVGHVFGLDGITVKGDTRKISVKDPFSEFDFISFKYLPGNFYDGYYSELGVFSLISAWSLGEAKQIYQSRKIDRQLKNIYAHVIKPKKPQALVSSKQPAQNIEIALDIAKSLKVSFEGFGPFANGLYYAYPDPKTGDKPYTIYLGLTEYPDKTPVNLGDAITPDEAEKHLNELLTNYYLPSLEKIPYWYEMDSHQKGALISFAWNLGPNFYQVKSGFNTIQKALRDKDWDKVPDALKLYYNPSDEYVRLGLYRRRCAEAMVWVGVPPEQAFLDSQHVSLPKKMTLPRPQ